MKLDRYTHQMYLNSSPARLLFGTNAEKGQDTIMWKRRVLVVAELVTVVEGKDMKEDDDVIGYDIVTVAVPAPRFLPSPSTIHRPSNSSFNLGTLT